MNKTSKHRLSLLILLIVTASTTIWISLRWKVWFGMPDEPAYIAVQNPERIMLTLGGGDELSRNISWQCNDKLEPSWVEIVRLDDSLYNTVEAQGEVFKSRSGKAAYYVARLRGLKEGCSYRYRVKTGDMSSDWYTFSTQQAKSDEMSFVYTGDVQDYIGGQTNTLLLSAFNRHNPSLLVCGGDIIERPSDCYWQEAFDGLRGIRERCPVICATGNHDYMKTFPNWVEKRFSLVFSYFLDSHIDDNLVATFTYNNIQFFLLDSNRLFPDLLKQKEWLVKELDKSMAQWKIIVVHHPLYSISSATKNLIQRWAFDDVIREHRVDLVLQGHEHAYARMTGGETERKETPVYTISHCSPKNYRIEFNERFDKFGISSRYYQFVRTKGDSLFMSAYEVPENILYDSIVIVKHDDNCRILDYGKNIKENMSFNEDLGNKKNRKFLERIIDYCNRHPERIGKRP